MMITDEYSGKNNPYKKPAQIIEWKPYVYFPKLNPAWMVKNNISYDTILDSTLLPPREEYEAVRRAAHLTDKETTDE